MEREIIFTGIGGQGIQLMAKILAQAAANEDKEVMLFGVYGGMMRGGSSESTIVIGDEEIQAPPIIPHCWSVVAMHPMGLAEAVAKLRPEGLLFANQTLVQGAPRNDVRVAGIPATRMAEQAGNIMGAGMIALGAFAALTDVVRVESVVAAMRQILPPHRQHLAERNVTLLTLGAAHVRGEGACGTPPRKAQAAS